MDVELKWHERPLGVVDPADPWYGLNAHYLVDPGGLVLASVQPCDTYPGCWSVRTFVPLARWVGITVEADAGRRLAELARTDTHAISRWTREHMPIEPGLPAPKPCVICGNPTVLDEAKCYDCTPRPKPVVDVTPDPQLEGVSA